MNEGSFKEKSAQKSSVLTEGADSVKVILRLMSSVYIAGIVTANTSPSNTNKTGSKNCQTKPTRNRM